MFEFLSESQCIRGTGLYAKAAETAHRKMIDVLINDPYFFSIRAIDPYGDDLDRTVGTVGLADPTPGAAMLVVIVMRHDHFTLKPVVHLKGFPVLGILLRYNLSGAEKVLAGDGHPYQEGFHAVVDLSKIFKKVVHSFLKMPTH
jgi:hypothetical protein